MTLQFSITSLPASAGGPYALSRLKNHLVSAGWTVTLSGDGVSTGGAGDNWPAEPVTDGDAWYTIRSPDAAKEFTFSRTANDNRGDWWYSPTAAFTGGTATSRATAVDEIAIAVSFNQFNSTAATLALCADDADPYGWYMLGWTTGFTAILCRYVYDPVISADPSDTDPYVMHCSSSGGGPSNFGLSDIGSTSNSTGNVSRVVATLNNGSFSGGMPGLNYRRSTTIVVPGEGPNSVFSGAEQTWPIIYARDVAAGDAGYKGIGTFVRWNGLNHAALGDTSDDRSRILFGDVNVPWDGSTVPQP